MTLSDDFILQVATTRFPKEVTYIDESSHSSKSMNMSPPDFVLHNVMLWMYSVESPISYRLHFRERGGGTYVSYHGT